jgi:hypothetical protein
MAGRRRLPCFAIAPVLVVLVLVGACTSGHDRTGPQYEADATIVAPSAGGHAARLCREGLVAGDPPACDGIEVVGWRWGRLKGEQSKGGVRWVQAHVVGTFDGRRLHPTRPPVRYQRPPVQLQNETGPACSDPAGDAAVRPPEHIDLTALGPALVGTWVSDPVHHPDAPLAFNVVVRPGSRAGAEAAVRRVYGGLLCVVEQDGPSLQEKEQAKAELTAEAARWRLVRAEVRSTRDNELVATVLLVTEAQREEAIRRWHHAVVFAPTLRPLVPGA